ncbi:MAG: hypothetical protein ACSLEL_04050 [Candidatus Malihini olakiniferum]
MDKTWFGHIQILEVIKVNARVRLWTGYASLNTRFTGTIIIGADVLIASDKLGDELAQLTILADEARFRQKTSSRDKLIGSTFFTELL